MISPCLRRLWENCNFCFELHSQRWESTTLTTVPILLTTALQTTQTEHRLLLMWIITIYFLLKQHKLCLLTRQQIYVLSVNFFRSEIDSRSRTCSTLVESRSSTSSTGLDVRPRASSTRTRTSSTGLDPRSSLSSTSFDSRLRANSTGFDPQSKTSSTRTRTSSTGFEPRSRTSSTSLDPRSRTSSMRSRTSSTASDVEYERRTRKVKMSSQLNQIFQSCQEVSLTYSTSP